MRDEEKRVRRDRWERQADRKARWVGCRLGKHINWEKEIRRACRDDRGGRQEERQMKNENRQTDKAGGKADEGGG